MFVYSEQMINYSCPGFGVGSSFRNEHGSFLINICINITEIEIPHYSYLLLFPNKVYPLVHKLCGHFSTGRDHVQTVLHHMD